MGSAEECFSFFLKKLKLEFKNTCPQLSTKTSNYPIFGIRKKLNQNMQENDVATIKAICCENKTYVYLQSL